MYPEAVRMALSDYNYNFATKTVVLGQSAIPEIPYPYRYAYTIPPDYIRYVGGLNCAGNISWSVYNTTRIVMTMNSVQTFTYVWDIQDYPELFPINFKMGVVYFLAGLISSHTTGIKSENSRRAEDRLFVKARGMLVQHKQLDAIERGYRENEDVWPGN